MTAPASHRLKRVTQAAAASAAVKLIVVGTNLIVVPLTLGFLGPERYGMWMTMTALIAMLSFADFGIGNGVLTQIARSAGRDDWAQVRSTISNGFVALGGIALLLLIVIAAVFPLLPWADLFNVASAEATSEAGPAALVFAACFALAIPLGVVQRVQMGLQLGYLAALWQGAGSVLGLLGVLTAVKFEASLPWMVASLAGLPALAALINTAVFFYRRSELIPRRADVSAVAMRRVLHGGGLFFVLQLVGALAYLSDSLVISQIVGAAAVAPFAVVERMFAFIPMLLMMALAPLWPAYAEALGRGDLVWARSTLRRSLLASMAIGTAAALVLAAAGPWLIHAWVGPSVEVGYPLLYSFAVWKVIEAAGIALAMFLNGAHVVRFQVFIGIATALVALSGKILLVQQVGVMGVLWASAAGYLLCSVLPILAVLPGLLRPPASAQAPTTND